MKDLKQKLLNAKTVREVNKLLEEAPCYGINCCKQKCLFKNLYKYRQDGYCIAEMKFYIDDWIISNECEIKHHKNKIQILENENKIFGKFKKLWESKYEIGSIKKD